MPHAPPPGAWHRLSRATARLRDRAGTRWPWLRSLGSAEVLLLGSGLAAVLVLWLFLELADEVQEGSTNSFDVQVVQALRRAEDRAVPIGPVWLREVGMDLTALGGHAILVLAVASVAGFLALRRQWRGMTLVLVASLGATVLSSVAKALVGRQRPDVVPHLREVTSLSFPSGHATLAAAVYLTLGAIVAQLVRGRWTRAYCLLLPMFVAGLVGASRVYLGVHYPTDVLGGWALGLGWALACWAVAHYLRQRGLLATAATPAAGANGAMANDAGPPAPP